MAKTKEKTKETEVNEVKQDVAVTTASVPATLEDQFAMIEGDAGVGNDFAADDLAIPRFGIVQSLSPQRQKTHANYIPGAEEGMFYSNLGNRVWPGDPGIIIVPIAYQKTYVEWHPRNSDKKGLVKNHAGDSTLYDATPLNDKGKRVTKDGTIIRATAEYYAFIVDEKTGEVLPGVMSFSSVFLKQAKKWNSLISLLRVKNPKTGVIIEPPIFYQAYKMTAVPESNKDGNWFRQEIVSYKSIFELPDGKSIYERAKAFRESVKAGTVKVAEPEVETAAAAETDADPM